MIQSELRFTILEEKLGNILSYKLLDKYTGEYVVILPDFGGAINNMALLHENKLVEIIDGYKSEENLLENIDKSFKGSNLFPFPNRIRDGQYAFRGMDYQLALNFPQENNAIHGMVFNQAFKVADKEDGAIGCKLILEYVSVPRQGYPFEYLLKITYKLKEGTGFECKMKLANLADMSIPVGHGWHPYFTAGSETIDELSLQFPANHQLDVDERNIPTGSKMPYQEFNELITIKDTVLDNCFHVSQDNAFADIVLQNNTSGFGYKIWQETGKYKYNFVQIYTPPDRKSIAIEPMTCAPDAFNNQNGLIILGPFETIQAIWGVSHLK